MPIYEYKCAECGNRIEKIQKISDAPLTVCENCGGKLEKQVSLSGFQFKGAGWYVTDYAGKKTDKGAAPAKSDTGDKTEKADSTAPKSENNSSSESTTKTETASNKSSESNSTKD